MSTTLSSLTDQQCNELAAWSRREAAKGAPPRIVVERDRTPGEPFVTDEPAVYVHPEDYLALRRWADRQELPWI